MKLRQLAAGASALAIAAAGALFMTAGTASAADDDVVGGEVTECPDLNGPGNTNPTLTDDGNINVYVGGDFNLTLGAEIEGTLVVNGDAEFNSGSNLGEAVGSGLQPLPGSPVLIVGGDVENNTTFQNTGDIVIGGNLTGTGGFNNPTVSQGVGYTAALGGFAEWPTDNFQVLSDVADRNISASGNGIGSYTTSGGEYLHLHGAPGASRHYIEIPAVALPQPSWGATLDIDTTNIAPTDPIVVNVTGSSVSLKLAGVNIDMASEDTTTLRFGQLASQILWVFSDATDVELTGGAQFPGSVIVPTPGSNTLMTLPGANGRFWVAGNLTQNAAGSEFHAYPFIGDGGMTCGEPPAPGEETATSSEEETSTSSEDPTVTTSPPASTGSTSSNATVTTSSTGATESTNVSTSGTSNSNASESPDGSREVSPEDPQVVIDPDGNVVIPADTDCITYAVSNANPAPGETVTVTATAEFGCILVLGENWVLNGDGTATFTVTLPAAAGLASTGVDTTGIMLIGLALVGAGAVALTAAARRHAAGAHRF